MGMSTATGELLTTNDVAELLGVTPIRVRQFATEKDADGNARLPSHCVEGRHFFERKIVEKFAKKPRKTGKPKKKSA